MGLNGLAVSLRKNRVDGLLQDQPATETLVDQTCRNLALAEARNVYLLSDVCVGGVDCRLQVFKGQINGELHPRGAELL